MATGKLGKGANLNVPTTAVAWFAMQLVWHIHLSFNSCLDARQLHQQRTKEALKGRATTIDMDLTSCMFLGHSCAWFSGSPNPPCSQNSDWPSVKPAASAQSELL